jgi:effector-binding domain-containing protein
MMSYEVLLSEALPRPLAAVRRTVPVAAIPRLIQGLLGEVWQFLGEQKIRSSGHNVAIYLAASGGAGGGTGGEGGSSSAERSVDAWFGVEVHEVIPASDQVVATSTPDGRVASAVHWGQYADLGNAHTAVREWCQANGHRITGTSWEVYGDWFDDWAKVRTDVFYLLATR